MTHIVRRDGGETTVLKNWDPIFSQRNESSPALNKGQMLRAAFVAVCLTGVSLGKTNIDYLAKAAEAVHHHTVGKYTQSILKAHIRNAFSAPGLQTKLETRPLALAMLSPKDQARVRVHQAFNTETGFQPRLPFTIQMMADTQGFTQGRTWYPDIGKIDFAQYP